MKFQGEGVTVHIADEVVAIWLDHKQTAPNSHEAFGVLIGSTSEDKSVFWFESVTVPQECDESSRYSFLLQDLNHQKAVDKAFSESQGKSIYLGTWHTHPQVIPIPSSIDKADWKKCIRKNKSRQLFFVVIGTEEIHIFVKSSFGFKSLQNLKGSTR